MNVVGRAVNARGACRVGRRQLPLPDQGQEHVARSHSPGNCVVKGLAWLDATGHVKKDTLASEALLQAVEEPASVTRCVVTAVAYEDRWQIALKSTPAARDARGKPLSQETPGNAFAPFPITTRW